MSKLEFGRLTVKKDTGLFHNGKRILECECSCGSVHVLVREDHLLSGATRSCGCLILTEGDETND
jgi:hypothetical protein